MEMHARRNDLLDCLKHVRFVSISAKEVMFYPAFVCLSVCLSVCLLETYVCINY